MGNLRLLPLILLAALALEPVASGQVAPTHPATPLQPAPGSASESVATDSTPAKLPAWDVVSVKPSAPVCTEGSGIILTHDGIHVFCVPILFLIEMAWDINETSRILDAPEWVKSGTRWDIDAKVAGEDVAAFAKLSRKERGLTFQALLSERFHLKAHMEQREIPVYELAVAKGGPKLKEGTEEESKKSHMLMRGQGKVEAVGATLSGLPWILNSEVGRPIVDKTGLTGKYDFTLEFVPASKAATDETGGPSIFTAVEEQLGLKLEPAKEPTDVLVIDSIEQPTAN